MWTTLALLSAMSSAPAQPGQLELKNARYTYGLHGQERKENAFFPGDLVILAFDIEGLKVKNDGIARYSFGFKLIKKKTGKPIFEKEATEYTVKNSLGGSHHPLFLMTTLFHDMEPGEYTTAVEIKDLEANSSAKLDRTFTLKPAEFGLVRVGFVYIPNQASPGAQFTPAPPLAVPGQNLMLHFTLVGVGEAGPKNDPNVSVQAVIQDEAGKPVLEKPLSGVVTSYAEDEYRKRKEIPFQFPILVNRTGKFKIVVTATDKTTGKTATLPPLDLTAVEVK